MNKYIIFLLASSLLMACGAENKTEKTLEVIQLFYNQNT